MENFQDLTNIPKNNTSNQTVIANDVDGDGDLDLFIGARVIPDKYPYSPKSQLLINDNGMFIDQTETTSSRFINSWIGYRCHFFRLRYGWR